MRRHVVAPETRSVGWPRRLARFEARVPEWLVPPDAPPDPLPPAGPRATRIQVGLYAVTPDEPIDRTGDGRRRWPLLQPRSPTRLAAGRVVVLRSVLLLAGLELPGQSCQRLAHGGGVIARGGRFEGLDPW